MPNKIKFTLEQEYNILDLIKTYTQPEIRKLLGVSESTLYRFLKSKGLINLNKKVLTKKQRRKIVQLSKTLSNKNISKLFNVNIRTIREFLNKKGIKNCNVEKLDLNKLPIDVDYFKTIDSHEKAYWLGFLYADGGFKNNGKTISLALKDLEPIEKFKKAIESGHKITERSYFLKATGKIYKSYGLAITNPKFSRNLINLGMTPNKSNVLEFPDIKEKFRPSFIAGLFDGDGCISKGKSKCGYVCFQIGTKEILEFIQEILFDKFGTKKAKLQRVSKDPNLNVWKIAICKDSLKFLEYIYDESMKDMYLYRKYELYLKAKENFSNRQKLTL